MASPGDLDPTFGAGGRVIVDLPDGTVDPINTLEGGTALLQQPDGKLLVGRKLYYWNAGEDLSVVRLNVDGRLDTTFGTDGRTSVQISRLNGSTQALLRQADGRIVAAGSLTGSTQAPADTTRLALARYLADGTVDSSFGDSGVVVESFGLAHASAAALIQQPNGRLIVGGYVASDTGVPDMLLARFNADGSFDPTFGTSGSRVIDFLGEQGPDRVRALALQADGKLLVLGDVRNRALGLRNGRSARIVLLRTMPDGSLDGTFGQGGFTSINLGGLFATDAVAAGALHVLADGKIIVGAQIMTGSIDTLTNCAAIVARLGADGTADTTFGDANGLARIQLGECYRPVENSTALEPNGAVLIANTTSRMGDVMVARVTPSGQVDDTFGRGGSATVDLAIDDRISNADTEFGVRLVRGSDGKMLVAASDGFDWDFGGSYFVVARLLASGSSAGIIGVRYPYVLVNETDLNATFTVRRTGGSAGSVSVDFAVTADTGVDGVDFASANGTLTWANGDAAEKEIQVRVLDDTSSDGWKYARVVLSNASGGASFSSSRGFLQIEDNEPALQPPAPPAPLPAPRGDSGGGASGWALLYFLAFVWLCRRIARLEGRAPVTNG